MAPGGNVLKSNPGGSSKSSGSVEMSRPPGGMGKERPGGPTGPAPKPGSLIMPIMAWNTGGSGVMVMILSMTFFSKLPRLRTLPKSEKLRRHKEHQSTSIKPQASTKCTTWQRMNIIRSALEQEGNGPIDLRQQGQ